MPHARPHLLPVHHEVVTLARRPRLEIGQVGSRVGLREPLAPEILGGENAGQESLLLVWGAVLHERGAQHGEPTAIDKLRRLGARHLLVEDNLLDERGAAPTEFARPVHTDVARLVHPVLPRAQLGHFFGLGA
jgi:hypothetical protein